MVIICLILSFLLLFKLYEMIKKAKEQKEKEEEVIKKLQKICIDRFVNLRQLVLQSEVMSKSLKDEVLNSLILCLILCKDIKSYKIFLSEIEYWENVLENELKYSQMKDINNERNEYLKILGLPPNVDDFDEIKKQYRKLAKKFHPDICHRPDAEKIFIN